MSDHPVRLVISDDLSRKRLTVFFRLILVIPHYLWLAAWGVVALLAAIANWIATLVAGRSPAPLHRFLARYVKYATHVYAYLYLAADPYPPFDGGPGYPVDVEIPPPEPQNRLTVAFRLILVIPALLLAAALLGAPSFGSNRWRSGDEASFNFGIGIAHAAAFLGWFVSVARRRMSHGLRDSVAWGVGYGAQLWAYLFLLTSRYPDSDPEVVLGGLPVRSDPIILEAEDDLRRSRLTVFFRLLLAFPHFVWLMLWGVLVFFAAIANWAATLVQGRPPVGLHRFLSAYLRYQAHVYAFVSLIANPFPGFAGSSGSYPVEVAVAAPARQNRWTVGFRLVLVLPAWLLGAAYGSVLWPVALLGWFASLVTGKMPRSLRNTGVQSVRYSTQVYGYVYLLTDAYPYLGPCRIPGLSGGPEQPPEALPVAG
ncbi:MAG: hypothetical protein JWL67_875 [Solirubrobacterales bacterium]|nr:hypothetical protein [Solirubrobacterales bacterium]